MEREPVVSSNIEEIGYDPDNSTLEVMFKGGSVYQYIGVPPEEHDRLMNAASIGGHFSSFIKGVYRCERC